MRLPSTFIFLLSVAFLAPVPTEAAPAAAPAKAWAYTWFKPKPKPHRQPDVVIPLSTGMRFGSGPGR